MYVNSSSPANSSTSPYVPTATGKLRADVAAAQAYAAYQALMCRNPVDFLPISQDVAADVQLTNQEYGCSFPFLPGAAGPSAGSGGAAGTTAGSGGGGSAAGGPGSTAGSGGGGSALAPNGARGRSCALPVSSGLKQLPLNGPGSNGGTTTTVKPVQLTAPDGLGRWSGGRRRRSLIPARRARGMGQCCSGFPEWGDAFPSGVPSAALSTAADISAWIGAHPFLSAALAIGGVLWLGAAASKGGKRV